MSMPILPHYALFVILLLAGGAAPGQHRLVRAAAEPLPQALAVTTGTGLCRLSCQQWADAPVVHNSARTSRALLVRHLQDLSFRASEELIDNHLLFK